MNKIEITNSAQDHIASILQKDSANYFRITVLGGGCEFAVHVPVASLDVAGADEDND